MQTRLRAEIKEYMPFLFDPETRTKSEFLDKADPDLLPYLDNVCRETLRYIPAIPMTVRQNVKADKLGDYEIPPGTTVYVLAQVINRMPDYWGPTADKFDPDRWDNLPPTYTANACKSSYMINNMFQLLIQFSHDLPPRSTWMHWSQVCRNRNETALMLLAQHVHI